MAVAQQFDTIEVDWTEPGIELAGKIENDRDVHGILYQLMDALELHPTLSGIEKVALNHWISDYFKAICNAAAKAQVPA